MGSRNLLKRGRKVAKECQEKIQKMGEKKDFRARVEYRHIKWKQIPTSALTSVTDKVDNIFRNYAYKNSISGSYALIHFFNSKKGKALLREMEKECPQRPNDWDWKAWRRAIQRKELNSHEKKVDRTMRRFFDQNYGKNTSSFYEQDVVGEKAA